VKLFGSLGGSSSSPPSETEADTDDALLDGIIDRTESVTGEPYVIEAVGTIREAGLITKIEVPAPEDEAKETDVVAGPAILEQVEEAYEGGSNPILPLGYDDSGGKLTVTGIRLSDAFEHTFIAGSTGSAKSTVTRAIMVVLAYAGYGFLSVFPKGSEDADDLIAALPEHRLDDVILIDPTEPEHTIPMNLLDVPDFDDPAEKDEEISKRVDVIKAVLMQDYGDGYINVETIIEVVSRAMMYSDEDYCFVDMFLLLNSQQRREDFVEDIDNPLLADAMSEVASMEDDEVRPVLKRLMSWVLDPTILRTISHRQSALDWRDVVDEDKIVLVKLGVSNKAVKRQIVLNVWRSLTAAVQQRYTETGKQIPYAAFLDEFNDVASDKLNIQDNLARARSMGLALFIICQYPSQLPEIGDDSVLDAVLNNANNAVALRMKDTDDAGIMADKLRGISATDIIEFPKYRCWTDVPVGNGERSDALQLKTIPPMPPLRTEDETEALIEDILKREGVAPPSISELIDGVPFGDFSADELLDIGEDSESLEFDESMRAKVCKAVYDQAIRNEAEDGWVRLDSVAPRIRRYLPGTVTVDTTEQLSGRVIEKIPESHLERDVRDDALYLRCTDEGKLPIFAQGDKQNSAGPIHRQLLNNAYDPLTELGLVVTIPEQDGGEELDAVATLEDVEPLQLPNDATPKQIHDAYERFETDEEYALLNRLTDGETVSIEAEESTGSTAPAQTIENLAKALNQGRRCLFLARTEEIAAKIWDHLNEDPQCMRSTSREGCHRFYNMNDDVLRVGGNAMYRPEGPRDTAWYYDTRTGEYILSDSAGEDHARFDSVEDVFTDPTPYPAVEGQIEDYDEWKEIKPPAIPEHLFDDELDDSRWDIIVVDTDAEETLMIYEDGTPTPLSEVVERETTHNPLADL
jgi:hypothetical protein